MNNVIDSWKNKKVFEKQLELNLRELNNKSTYPAHWNSFIEFISQIKPSSILDVGCGCGSLCELCRIEFPNIKYTGMDYSDAAIDIANKQWASGTFYVNNYLSLTKEYVLDYDLIYMGAVLDILPNGDEGLEFILSLDIKKLLIGRVKLTNNNTSFYTIYKAYDEIQTCAYYHNEDNFLKTCDRYNYKIKNINNNFYLEKI